MPTVSWIQETAADRYWEHIGLGPRLPPTPTVHPCPYCASQFQTTSALSKHISVNHPVERPLLLIKRRPAYSEQTIRSPIHHGDLTFTHVTGLRVSKDGEAPRDCSPNDLNKLLSVATNAHYSITLTNVDPNREREVQAHYIVRIKLSDPTELHAVDEQFITHLAIDNVRMSDVRRFSDASTKYSSADEYASALAVYVIAVLIKDQDKPRGVSLPLADYKPRMQQALATLHDFDRPIPRAVCATIKFNLNDFHTPPLPCGSPLLDKTNDFFHAVARGLADAPPRWNNTFPSARELPACPIDRESYELLEIFQNIAGEVVDPNIVADLSAAVLGRSFSDYDLSKLRVLTALAAIRSHGATKPIPVLEELVHDSVFGAWAQSQIEIARQKW